MAATPPGSTLEKKTDESGNHGHGWKRSRLGSSTTTSTESKSSSKQTEWLKVLSPASLVPIWNMLDLSDLSRLSMEAKYLHVMIYNYVAVATSLHTASKDGKWVELVRVARHLRRFHAPFASIMVISSIIRHNVHTLQGLEMNPSFDIAALAACKQLERLHIAPGVLPKSLQLILRHCTAIRQVKGTEIHDHALTTLCESSLPLERIEGATMSGISSLHKMVTAFSDRLEHLSFRISQCGEDESRETTNSYYVSILHLLTQFKCLRSLHMEITLYNSMEQTKDPLHCDFPTLESLRLTSEITLPITLTAPRLVSLEVDTFEEEESDETLVDWFFHLNIPQIRLIKFPRPIVYEEAKLDEVALAKFCRDTPHMRSFLLSTDDKSHVPGSWIQYAGISWKHLQQLSAPIDPHTTFPALTEWLLGELPHLRDLALPATADVVIITLSKSTVSCTLTSIATHPIETLYTSFFTEALFHIRFPNLDTLGLDFVRRTDSGDKFTTEPLERRLAGLLKHSPRVRKLVLRATRSPRLFDNLDFELPRLTTLDFHGARGLCSEHVLPFLQHATHLERLIVDSVTPALLTHLHVWMRSSFRYLCAQTILDTDVETKETAMVKHGLLQLTTTFPLLQLLQPYPLPRAPPLQVDWCSRHTYFGDIRSSITFS